MMTSSKSSRFSSWIHHYCWCEILVRNQIIVTNSAEAILLLRLKWNCLKFEKKNDLFLIFLPEKSCNLNLRTAVRTPNVIFYDTIKIQESFFHGEILINWKLCFNYLKNWHFSTKFEQKLYLSITQNKNKKMTVFAKKFQFSWFSK